MLAGRGRLAPLEVVTLVVGLALDLADLHASGRTHGDVRAESVWFEPNGRPRLSPPVAAVEPAEDTAALAALGLRALGGVRSTRLSVVLTAGITDAGELAERVLASGPAAPLGLRSPGKTPVIEASEPHASRRRGPVLAVLVVVVVVLAAAVCTVHRVDRPAPWRNVLAALDRARSAAVAVRSTAELRAVYADGSAQLGRDAALIRRLSRDRLTLRGRLAELTDPTVIGATTLSAVERPASYVLVDARGHVVLRVDNGPVRRVVVRLRHTGAGWRVVDVS